MSKCVFIHFFADLCKAAQLKVEIVSDDLMDSFVLLRFYFNSTSKKIEAAGIARVLVEKNIGLLK